MNYLRQQHISLHSGSTSVVEHIFINGRIIGNMNYIPSPQDDEHDVHDCHANHEPSIGHSCWLHGVLSVA